MKRIFYEGYFIFTKLLQITGRRIARYPQNSLPVGCEMALAA
jgi:hypothetical protein